MSQPMKLLALDLGSHCGWAFWDGARMESGVQIFDLKRGESSGWRFVRFNAWLDAWLERKPELVVYEMPHQRGGAATEIAAGFSTRIHEWCARHGIEHSSLHSATLKKWATGKGNADKAAMLGAVARRWKRVDTDDEADALALAYWALEELILNMVRRNPTEVLR
jgi:Holliday junction resolvasome RuvABC endonuclease subunit